MIAVLSIIIGVVGGLLTWDWLTDEIGEGPLALTASVVTAVGWALLSLDILGG